MGTNVFISFRFSDGKDLKEELVELFDESIDVYNRSEDVDRSSMSDETIQYYLYEKIKDTSVTIVLLTPEALQYRWNLILSKYDDWLYDELRYSLEDRDDNRTNGVVAIYTEESENLIYQQSTHICNICNEQQSVRSILDFKNLVRKNVLNVKDKFKSNSCIGLYDSEKDSYISLIHIDDFKKNYSKYIEDAKDKRNRKEQFELVKKM
ncbi:TIR domain-containing protein [Fundicoccus culcitae]|uniref:TIR domain-containing protein n=1 Tax=Fundicoccus culcitae TaxID=2969821 RepID=A0ABY5P9D6_9LACT|nr:TIR domain-containing protein [Fundicoccus culcitae]UUX35206.1 TIR domain-containing protein [Fundicoccus culcitae]